jgi:5-deoxy-D-glucuronate isomerase
MTLLTTIPLQLLDGARTATLPSCTWLAHLSVLAIDSAAALTTGDYESCALVLAGTFDLVGGGTAWPARGARTTPTGGRPVAVFLPPRTRFVAANGTGEILLLGARQPTVPEPTGKDALQKAPLLQMAGSGKAFDPGTGEWKPAETFPSSPESLPPRRIERLALAGCVVERVFPQDYKAATLSVDEIVLADGGTFAARELPLPQAQECLLYVRTTGELDITAHGQRITVRGEQAVLWQGAPDQLTCTARGGTAYVVCGYAGKERAAHG